MTDIPQSLPSGHVPGVLLAHHLKALKLPTILREYDKIAHQCAAEGVDYPRYLLRLVEAEIIERERRMVDRRIKAAKFPTVKSIDSFDFAAFPDLNKALVMELARSEYVERRENVIAVGNSGTGKSHIGLGLGLAACQKGLSVGFANAAAIVHELIEARDEKRLLRLQRQLAAYKLLIIDELGFVPLSQRAHSWRRRPSCRCRSCRARTCRNCVGDWGYGRGRHRRMSRRGAPVQAPVHARFASPKFFSLGKSRCAISSSRTDFLMWKIAVGIAMLKHEEDRPAVLCMYSTVRPCARGRPGTVPHAAFLHVMTIDLRSPNVRNPTKPPAHLSDTWLWDSVLGASSLGHRVGRCEKLQTKGRGEFGGKEQAGQVPRCGEMWGRVAHYGGRQAAVQLAPQKGNFASVGPCKATLQGVKDVRPAGFPTGLEPLRGALPALV